jgi:hypothetical protein
MHLTHGEASADDSRHNLTDRSTDFELWRTIAAKRAQDSSNPHHIAAPLADDR